MLVAEGIHRLTGGVCNFYVIDEGGRRVLVDAGAPADWALLARTMDELGWAIDSIEAVLLTHAHSDHTGFAERARRDAGARIYVHDRDRSMAQGAKPPKNESSVARHLLHAEAYRTMVSLARRGATRIVPIAEVSSFNDGETLDLPGRPRVLHTPGHTAGSSSVYLEQAAAVCSGDALVMRNPLTGRTGPQVMPSALNQSTSEALASLDRLPTSARSVLPGHGEPWIDGVGEAVRLAKLAGRS